MGIHINEKLARTPPSSHPDRRQAMTEPGGRLKVGSSTGEALHPGPTRQTSPTSETPTWSKVHGKGGEITHSDYDFQFHSN